LHLACTGQKRDHQSIVQMLLQLDTIDVNVKDHDGRTALHLASISGQAYSLEQLLNNYNADVNAKDKDGRTALHYACFARNGGVSVMSVLLEDQYGADVSAVDAAGRTPLGLAKYVGNKDVESMLQKRY